MYTKSGDILTGELSQNDAGGFVVSRDDLTATLEAGPGVSIVFPRADVAPQAADDPFEHPQGRPEHGRRGDEKRIFGAAATRRGSTVIGADPEFDGTRMSLTLVGGGRVTLAADVLGEMSFSTRGGMLPHAGVLAWGRFADRDDEFKKTLEVLKRDLGPGWRIKEDFGDFDKAFEDALATSGALLIPEMEQWRGSEMALADRLKPLAEAFLRRGGNVVILGPSANATEFLKRAGLIDCTYTTSSSSQKVSFTNAGARISAGVGASFQTANATFFYRAGGSGVTSLAESSSGAPILARQVGRGWVIVLGMDYYKHNDQTARLLVNAVTYR